MSLSVILTCYNEVPIVFDSYEKIVSMMDLARIDYDMIIVDDGSRSDVRNGLRDYFKDKKNTILLFSDVNEGRGAAVTKALKASSKEFAGFIDVDLEIPECSLLTLFHIMAAKKLDIIIGKRCYRLNWSVYLWLRIICSKAYYLLANSMLRLGRLDTESGIKIFRRENILPLLDSVEDKRWFWDTEIIAEALRNNLKVTQAPVFVSRGGKKSTVNVFRDAQRYLMSLYKYKYRNKTCT